MSFPKPFPTNTAPGTLSRNRFPEWGRIAVTPVRTSEPRMTVVCPTATPLISVIASSGPGDNTPTMIPSSRARSRDTFCASTGVSTKISNALFTAISITAPNEKRAFWVLYFLCCSSNCGSCLSLVTAALRSWIVRRIHILELHGTLTEEDNRRFLCGVGEVIDVRRHLRKTADRQCFVGRCPFGQLVPHAERHRARDHNDVLIGRMRVRGDRVVRGKLQSDRVCGRFGGIAYENSNLCARRKHRRRRSPVCFLRICEDVRFLRVNQKSN